MSDFRPLFPSNNTGDGFVPLRPAPAKEQQEDDGSGFVPGFRPLVPGRLGAERVGARSEGPGAPADELAEPASAPELRMESPGASEPGPAPDVEEPGHEDIGLLRAREDGFEHGRTQGFEAGQADVRAQVERLERLIAGLEGLRREIFERSVTDVAAAVNHIARAVVQRELLLDSSGIEALVIDVLDHVQVDDEVIIRVAPEDAQQMNEAAPGLLHELGRDATFRIHADPELSPGGAKIETQLGAIDASVETRFAAFADAVAEWAGEEASAHAPLV